MSDNTLFELIVPNHTPLMLNGEVIGIVTKMDDYYTCKIFKECISANLTSEDDKTYTVTTFEIKDKKEYI